MLLMRDFAIGMEPGDRLPVGGGHRESASAASGTQLLRGATQQGVDIVAVKGADQHHVLAPFGLGLDPLRLAIEQIDLVPGFDQGGTPLSSSSDLA